MKRKDFSAEKELIPLLFRNYLINRGNQSDSAPINFIGNVLLPLFALNYHNKRECLCLSGKERLLDAYFGFIWQSKSMRKALFSAVSSWRVIPFVCAWLWDKSRCNLNLLVQVRRALVKNWKCLIVERRGIRVKRAVTRIIIPRIMKATTVSQKLQIHSLICEECNLTFSSLFQRRRIFL